MENHVGGDGGGAEDEEEGRRHDSSASSGSSTFLLVKVGFFAALGGLLFGWDLGLISGALEPMAHSLSLSSTTEELVVGMLKAGATLGGEEEEEEEEMRWRRTNISSSTSPSSAPLGGAMMLQYGRLKALAFSSLFFIWGPVQLALAPNAATAIIARTIVGIGVGGSAVVVPAYLGEISPSRRRGMIVSLYEVAVAFGMVLSVFIDYAISLGITASWRWRLMVALPLFPGILLGMAFLFLPESPRWLVLRGRFDEALAVLRRMKGINGGGREDPDALAMVAEVEHELMEIWSHSEKERVAMEEQREKHLSRRSTRNDIAELAPTESKEDTENALEEKREPSVELMISPPSSSRGGELLMCGLRSDDVSPSYEDASPSYEDVEHDQIDSCERNTSTNSTPDKSNSGDIGKDEGEGGLSSSNFFVTFGKMMYDIVIVAQGDEAFALQIAIVLAIFNQFVASTAIINYGPKVLGLVGVESEEGKLLRTAGIALAKAIGILISLFLVDTLGRRTLLLFGSFGMTIGMILLCVALVLSSGALGVLSMCGFILAFSISWAGVFWVLISELFSMKSKSTAASAATAVLFASGAIVNLLFTTISNGVPTYWPLLYAGFAALSFLYVYFMLPETKGKTLTEVEIALRERGELISRNLRIFRTCLLRYVCCLRSRGQSLRLSVDDE